MLSFYYKLFIAYLILWNLVYTIYLLEFNIFTLSMQLKCIVIHLLALFMQKKHIFVQHLGQVADWPTYLCGL